MRPEALRRLTDVKVAGQKIIEYTSGLTEEDYLADDRTRDAVERRLATIGEALNKAVKADSSVADLFPEARQIIALRNILVHDYGEVEDPQIWRVATEEIPHLLLRVDVELSREAPSNAASAS